MPFYPVYWSLNVVNPPLSAEQLHRSVTSILNADVIGKCMHEGAIDFVNAFVLRINGYFNAFCGARVHKLKLNQARKMAKAEFKRMNTIAMKRKPIPESTYFKVVLRQP